MSIKTKNLEDFTVQKSNFDGDYISEIVFDEKGYVSHLYRYAKYYW